MDIKSTKPTLAQEIYVALNKESVFSDSPSLTQFVVRTMYGDLHNLPTHLITEAAPTTNLKDEIENQKEEKAAKEAEKKIREKKRAEKKKLETAANESRKKLAQEKREADERAKRASKEAALAAKTALSEAKQKIAQAKQAQQLQLRLFLEQAGLKLTAKEFDAAITEAEKI